MTRLAPEITKDGLRSFVTLSDWWKFLRHCAPISRFYCQELLSQAYISHPHGVRLFYAAEIGLPIFFLVSLMSTFPHLGMCLAMIGYICPRLLIFARIVLHRAQLRQELLNVLTLLLICVGMSDHFVDIFRGVGKGLRSSRPVMAEEVLRLCRELEQRDDTGRVWQSFAEKFQAKDFQLIVDMLYINQLYGADSSQNLKEQVAQFHQQRLSQVLITAERAELYLKLLHILCFLPIILIVLVGPILSDFSDKMTPLTNRSVVNVGEHK